MEIFSGRDFYERCRKSINLVFALSAIAGLALGVESVADPAFLIAVASGMSEVCVLTGDGSGMGLAAAKYMPGNKIIVLSGRTKSKLEKAAGELRETGHTTYIKTGDTSKREDVKELVKFAASLGEIRNVINSAGLSPNMAALPMESSLNKE